MFVLREIAVALTFFVLVYGCLSLIVLASWRGLRRLRCSEKTLAEILFLARVLPMFASIIFTGVFVIPSFQLLEPRATPEGIGKLPVVFGVVAISLVAFAFHRVFRAQTGTTRIVARWLKSARLLGSDLYGVSRHDVPPLTIVGLRKPHVLISDLALRLLTENEMGIALRHERAHIHSRDNLKKLIFRFCAFPGMGRLETAWAEASELAADYAAVSNASDAVDLATALVKLSRLVPIKPAPVCTVGFITGSVSIRVARLLKWDEATRQPSRPPRWAAISMLLATVIGVALTYGPILVITHDLTELLVR